MTTNKKPLNRRPKCSDISEEEVIQACLDYHRAPIDTVEEPLDALSRKYPWKVVLRKMEKMVDKHILEYGSNIRTAWPVGWMEADYQRDKTDPLHPDNWLPQKEAAFEAWQKRQNELFKAAVPKMNEYIAKHITYGEVSGEEAETRRARLQWFLDVENMSPLEQAFAEIFGKTSRETRSSDELEVHPKLKGITGFLKNVEWILSPLEEALEELRLRKLKE